MNKEKNKIMMSYNLEEALKKILSEGKKVKKNSVAEKFPEIARQWHQTKNGELTPWEVSYGSKREVYWYCEIHDYYLMSLNHRTNKHTKQKCPYCANQRVHLLNCLGTLYPEIAKFWHRTLNGKLTPYDVMPGSHNEYYWYCEVHGYYKMSPNTKTNMECGCPFCSPTNKRVHVLTSFGFLYPEIAKDWHPTMNGDVTPYDVLPGDHDKYYFLCEIHGAYPMRINDKVYDLGGCPICCESKGEKCIRDYLSNNDIKFTRQVKDIIPHRNRLLFDFLIEDYVFVEFDGSQHFEPKSFGSSENKEKMFEITKIRDEIKNHYCSENNIPLLRIPYWHHKDIDKIMEELFEHLSNLNLSKHDLFEKVRLMTDRLVGTNNPYKKKVKMKQRGVKCA